MCFNSFDPEMVWSENFHFKPFPDSHAKREREREREPNPQTELQSDDHSSARPRPSFRPTTTDRADRTAPIKQRSHRADCSTAPIATPCRSQHCALLSSFFSQFDRIWWIFFLGFVSFVFLYWGMILYICLAAEKMWVTSKKCVFYGIFKNTRKYFSKHFLKCYQTLENILHEPNTTLVTPQAFQRMRSGLTHQLTKAELDFLSTQ